jgi:hypothetical protein
MTVLRDPKGGPMFKKEKTEETPQPQEKNKVDETAYEDSWYRSLKQMADRDDETNDEQVGVPED